MQSGANYNMRALLLIVLISAAFADDPVHYPTNHPGVCNILAFVSDHVPEVVHVAHEEVEAITDKSSKSSTALMKEIQRVKRQVRDLMQVSQCLEADVKKEHTVANSQEIPLATSENPVRSDRDAINLPETYTTTHKPQNENVGKHQEITETLGEIATQSADQQQVLQPVAETQDVKQLVKDEVHLLQNIPTSETVVEAKQAKLFGNSKETQSDVTESPLQSSQHIVCIENKLRQVRDVVHLLGSFLHTPDATHNIAIKASDGNVDGLLPPTLEQPVATQERRGRNVVKEIGEQITEISKNQDSKINDALQQDSQHVSLQTTARDVAELLATQNILPCHFQNDVKLGNNLQNLKSDNFQTPDILPEETQHVAVQETAGYADQLFPPTIGQHVDFQERLKRNVVNVIEDEVNIPTKDSKYVASVKSAPRPVRDVRHLLEAQTTITPLQEQLLSAILQSTDIIPQASQHVTKEQGTEIIKENVGPTIEQNSAASAESARKDITLEKPQTVCVTTHEVPQQQLPHVATQENNAKVEATTVPQNRRKRNVGLDRIGPVSTVPQEYNVLKSKSKRSPDELQVSLDQSSQSQHNLNNQAFNLNDGQEHNKNIQIVKPRSIVERPRRSVYETLVDQLIARTKPIDTIKEVEDTQDTHANDDSLIEIATPTRVVRSLAVSLETAKELPIQHGVADVHSHHIANIDVLSSGDSSHDPSSTSTHNPIDSGEEFLQPTVKFQHPTLPLTQFARRYTTKKAR